MKTMGAEPNLRWRKAIPEARDRMQSRLLVWLMMPLMMVLSIVWGTTLHGGHADIEAWSLPLTFALIVWALRAGTLFAAFGGGLICFLVLMGTRAVTASPMRSGLAPLLVLFVLTFAATRAGRSVKQQKGLAEGRKGRNAGQVIANLGVAGGMAGIFGVWQRGMGGWLWLEPLRYGPGMLMSGVMVLAALAEATADTVSSEIGQAFGGRPLMLLTMRRVEAGTDGAVSVVGTCAGVAGAMLVAGVGRWAMSLDRKQMLISFAAGVSGLLFDSVLGATVERRGWLGNDLVNFSSTLFAVLVAGAMMLWL